MRRARRNGTITRRAPASSPTSIAIVRPSGSSTIAPSPCPTGRCVTRRIPSAVFVGQAQAIGASSAQAMARRRRRANAQKIDARPSAIVSPSAIVGRGTSIEAPGMAAAHAASASSPSAPHPATTRSGAPRPGAAASSSPPTSERGTKTSDPSGAAGTLARMPISEMRPKCTATSGAVASVAASEARATASAIVPTRGSRGDQSAARWRSITSRPNSAPNESWSDGSASARGLQARSASAATATLAGACDRRRLRSPSSTTNIITAARIAEAWPPTNAA